MERKGHKNFDKLMKARKFLPLTAIPATPAKSTFILYLGYLRDENLSPNERKFIKTHQKIRGAPTLTGLLIHASSVS